MTKIDIKTSPPHDEKYIYFRLIEILQGIKLVGGNIFLNKTIHNHPTVKNFLLEYLKSDLIDLEREILELENK